MKKILSTFCLLVVLTVLSGLGGLWYLSSPLNPTDISVRSIVVQKGATGTSIAADLAKNNIIRSPLMVRLMLRSKDSLAPIQTGTYELSPSMSASQIADALLAGSKDMWVTLKEGWRSEEIADELTTNFGLRYFNPDDFLKLAKPQEGMLFPDTYLFPKQTTAAQIVKTLMSTFDDKYGQALTESGPGVLPKAETIVLASIVEREARTAADMKIVAGILINRLQAGIPLQVDSTLQYVKGYDASAKSPWWPTPKAADKFLKSPFNTYANKGLPPSPICNPGENALRAAIAPTKTDYLYYLSDNTSGAMHYAHTLEEHNANIEKYLR